MLVFVTPRAEKNFASIVDYISKKWGERTARQFVLKTDSLFQLLRRHPAMGQIENGDIRGFQLSRQTRILYRIRDEKIIILAFFDVRQNPDKKFN
jgi:plasmid stabilization system protein ParE